MIDYDLSGDFSNFILDSKNFFKQFNEVYPVEALAQDRGLMMIAFFLARISGQQESLESKRG